MFAAYGSPACSSAHVVCTAVEAADSAVAAVQQSQQQTYSTQGWGQQQDLQQPQYCMSGAQTYMQFMSRIVKGEKQTQAV